MKLRTILTGATALALTATLATAGGVRAADTAATFEIAAGLLTISEPATADLGSVGTGAPNLAGDLGDVTVTDERGLLVATWTASVSSTAFTTGTSADETVAGSAISYASGLATSDGTGTFVPQVGATLEAAKTAGSWTVGVGNNTSTWNPTLTFTLLPSQVAGTYAGTVTHSVA